MTHNALAVGLAFKAARLDQRLTVRELARRARIDKRVIFNLEKGSARTRNASLVMLQITLDSAPLDLFMRERALKANGR